jgi:Leucine-rich repeat (LRR) protein
MEEHHDLRAAAGDMLYNVEGALPRIKILVEVTERRAISNPNFAAWLQQFKDVVSEAEDLLDDFETKRIQEMLRTKVSSAAFFALKFPRNLVLSDDDLQRLKVILTRLDKITGNIGTFHDILRLADTDAGLMRIVQPTSPPVFFGRDMERQQLLKRIFPNVPQPPRDNAESSNVFSVICIVGKEGVGKTTLARVIYDNPNVREAFMLRGWVFASHIGDSRHVAKDIVDSFGAEQHDDAQIMHCSSDSTSIQNKRFFLVIDGAQDDLQKVWGSLSSTLAGGANGSVVLLTTQSQEIAIFFGTTPHITLNDLPFPMLWKIFEHHAFGKQKKAFHEPIGKKVVQNLHGLPLLAEAIGRLLRQKLLEGDWQKISESPWWYYSEDAGDVALPTVAIIFEHLTDNLRKCLYYSSIFPSGHLFEKNMLIHMWIASFMQQHDGVGIEGKEKEWFDKLLNRSFFQPTIWKRKYIIPDMIRKPICCIAQEEGQAAMISGQSSYDSLQLHRHLAINFADFNEHLDLGKDNKLRTILLFDGRRTIKLHEALTNIFSHPSGLRVLDLSKLSYPDVKLEKVPDVINKFTHLRFLDLSFTGITVFPDSLCKLYLLQVLGLRGCQFKELPRAMNGLINLRYLYAEAHTVSLVYKIGKLTNLQGLEEFPVSKKEGHRITELKDLNELRGQLCIDNLEEVTDTDDVCDAQLRRKRHIKKLVFKWKLSESTSVAASDGCMRTLDGLKPNANIQKIKIQCYMGVGFPAWMADDQYYKSLLYIHLTECKQLLTLPPLGQLQSLVILILQGLSVLERIGEEFYGESYKVFPSLEELKFLDMPKLSTWSEKEELNGLQLLPFPSLKKVQIQKCPVLRSIPECCLKAPVEELEISGCNEIFACNSNCLEGLKSLVHLKIHHCLGRIYLPCDLASLEVLSLQNCDIPNQEYIEQTIKRRRFLNIDLHQLKLDDVKADRKE